ncbi:MAG: SUMF1/EgtB/PvdO family nonheme iron enzyme [Treponema sp.]|nr:SUMF1/EgtB/PvdO family nonheme iron enzyme [Treponema sp.]
MKNKFKVITLFMSMMVIIAFASCKTETEYITKEYVASVTFTIEETTTEGTLAVVMATETKGAKIYYTVDNSVPSIESTEYTEKVTVNKNTVFKAIAIKEGMENSSISVATVEVEKIVYSSEISETGLYTVYQILQEKTGGKSIEDYEVFEVEENRTIEAGTTLEDIKKSYEGFTAKILAQNENAIYVFYDRNTITYTFQTGTEGKFEDGTIEKEVSGLYGTTYTRPKAPTSADYNFLKWLDSDGSVAPTTFGAENKTFVASWKLKGEGGDEIPEGFVFVAGTTITGEESWTPESNVFVSGRKLTIPDLYVSDHEVTRGEYKNVMGSDPSTASANDKDGNELEGDAVLNNPVNDVSWYDALVYCNKLSMQENLTPCYSIDGSTDPDDWGEVPTSSNSTWNAATCNYEAEGYRLPTEAEWEWLARGGENYIYAGSDNVDDVAWYTSNTNDTGTREVKTKAPNGYGLYDMSGNVYEWCWDWYGSISDSSAADGATSGNYRVQRGGSWYNYDDRCRVAYRYNRYPYSRDNFYGFRVVRPSSK